ncbi:Transcription Factor 7-Like 2 [Manis pentadactyla]|nr:Transcription Factor 7-Like 2 [Manis pentadactyla]
MLTYPIRTQMWDRNWDRTEKQRGSPEKARTGRDALKDPGVLCPGRRSQDTSHVMEQRSPAYLFCSLILWPMSCYPELHAQMMYSSEKWAPGEQHLRSQVPLSELRPSPPHSPDSFPT